MGALYYPAPGLLASFFSFLFFAPAANVSSVSKLPHHFIHLIIVVARVQAQPLVAGARCQMSQSLVFNHLRNTGQRRCHQFHIVTVGTFNLQSQRNARRFGQQTSFDAAFGAVAGAGAAFFPHPGVPLSSHHPGPSTQSPVLAFRRSQANSPPTSAQRSHPPATLETACEPSSVWHSASRLNCPDSATGRRCATGKRCCATPCGHSHEDDGIP